MSAFPLLLAFRFRVVRASLGFRLCAQLGLELRCEAVRFVPLCRKRWIFFFLDRTRLKIRFGVAALHFQSEVRKNTCARKNGF